MKENKYYAVCQSALLIFSIFAFTILLSGEMVSATDPVTPSSTTQPKKGLNQNCLFDSECSEGLVCIFSAGNYQGKVCTFKESSNYQTPTSNFAPTSESSGFNFNTISSGIGLTTGALGIYDRFTKSSAVVPNSQVVGSSTGAITGTAQTTTTAIQQAPFLERFSHSFFNSVPMKGSEEVIKEAARVAAEEAAKEAAKEAGKTITEEAIKEAGNKAAAEAAKEAGTYSTSTGGYILNSAMWAASAAALTIMVFKWAGASERNLQQIKGAAYVSAVGATAVSSIIAASGPTGPPGWMIGGAVVLATLAWTAFTYQEYSRDLITYQVGLWQPPQNNNCEDCNNLRYGCSEYQCRSYGPSCEIVNAGTKDELCIWVNKNDGKPPVIVSQIQLMNDDFKYTPSSNTQFSERGVKLQYYGDGANSENCIPPFTNVEFGVRTDEPAQCKIDVARKMKFEEMSSFMAEGQSYGYNHTLEIPSSAFPSQYALTEAGWNTRAGKEYDFFIRCRDKNGNVDPLHFSVGFCIDDSPDETAPIISTNYLENAFIKHNTTSIDNLEVYTNEPAECRWDFVDRSYEQMRNNMTDCSMSLGEYTFPRRYSYGCRATLTGLKDNVENIFYIRCQDKPLLPSDSNEKRISNEQSYELKLAGTYPLSIAGIKINGQEGDVSIVDSTAKVKVELDVLTSQGAGKNGEARCWYTPEGTNLRFEFYNNGNFDYSQRNVHDVYLEEGPYNYNITCCDLANNCDREEISFTVETDKEYPVVKRTYFEDGRLKFVTAEEAECVYTNFDCNYLYEDGTQISSSDRLDHYVEGDANMNYYVKCKDAFGNIPGPKDCSIIVRPHSE